MIKNKFQPVINAYKDIAALTLAQNKQLKTFLSNQPETILKQLANQNIKWVSTTAMSILKEKRIIRLADDVLVSVI